MKRLRFKKRKIQRMIIPLILISIFALDACAKAPAKTSSAEPEEKTSQPSDGDQANQDTTAVKTYQVTTVEDKETIPWEKIPKAEIDIYKWTDSDTFNAFAQMVYVKDYGLVCKMSCEETDPYTQFYKDGEDVYLDSAMECFLKLGEEGYINLETNSVGARLQEFGNARENRTSLFDIIPEGFQVDAGREGDFWTLTLHLPVEQLKQLYPAIDYKTFENGYSFTGNFYKIGTNPDTGVRHYGMWNDVDSDTPNFHLPEYFGRMTIEDD